MIQGGIEMGSNNSGWPRIVRFSESQNNLYPNGLALPIQRFDEYSLYFPFNASTSTNYGNVKSASVLSKMFKRKNSFTPSRSAVLEHGCLQNGCIRSGTARKQVQRNVALLL
jgi:hypothetical protein